MAKVYANQIRRGAITIENVPARWREQVRELLGDG